MKKLLAVLMLFGFACPMIHGIGEWKSGVANLYIYNKTKDVLSDVSVRDGAKNVPIDVKQVYSLSPGEAAWFQSRIYESPYLNERGKIIRWIKRISTLTGPLFFTYKGKRYQSTHFFSMPDLATWTMEIHPHNTRGAQYKGRPGIRHG